MNTQTDSDMAVKLFRGFTLFWLVTLRLLLLLLPITGLIFLLVRRPQSEKLTVALTGTFHSENWIVAHLKPLANCPYVKRVYVVSLFAVPPIDNVVHVPLSPLLSKLLGQTGARFIQFFWVCLINRPHVIGGFHFLFNGLYALVLSRLFWVKSLYFCVGGDAEFMGGGIRSENKYFERLQFPSPAVEKQLLVLAGKINQVITMGSSAAAYLSNNSGARSVDVIPGFVNIESESLDGLREQGIDPATRDYDLIFVGRFSPIKRLDLLVSAADIVSQKLDRLKVVLVGQGQLFDWVEQEVITRGLEDVVHLVGFQPRPGEWLNKAKIMILCSDSEGLSLALMESGYVGLPAVVSAVGDLGDLVVDGENGFLVKERTAEAFAAKVIALLEDDERYRQFSREAKTRARQYTLQATIEKWVNVFARVTPQVALDKSNQ